MRKLTVCQEKDNLLCTAQQARSLSPGVYVRLGKAGRDLQTTISSDYFLPLVLVITFTHSVD
jgi:hypothetical protein